MFSLAGGSTRRHPRGKTCCWDLIPHSCSSPSLLNSCFLSLLFIVVCLAKHCNYESAIFNKKMSYYCYDCYHYYPLYSSNFLPEGDKAKMNQSNTLSHLYAFTNTLSFTPSFFHVLIQVSTHHHYQITGALLDRNYEDIVVWEP